MSFHSEKNKTMFMKFIAEFQFLKRIQKVSVQEGMICKTMVFLKFFATEFGTNKVGVTSFLMSDHPRFCSYR